MKPWERALKREPMCAFIEAVVDGYSPLDKNLLRCARAGQLLRSLPWWTDLTFATSDGPRGHVTSWLRATTPVVQTGEELPGSWHQQKNGAVRTWAAVSGEFDAH